MESLTDKLQVLHARFMIICLSSRSISNKSRIFLSVEQIHFSQLGGGGGGGGRAYSKFYFFPINKNSNCPIREKKVMASIPSENTLRPT